MFHDVESPMAAPSRRRVSLNLGVLTLWVVELGYGTQIVGKFLGRLNVPGSPGGYAWVKVDVLGKNLFLGCVQLT